MPPTRQDDLSKRYRMYKDTYRELKRQKFTHSEAVIKTAEIHNLHFNTVKNALANKKASTKFLNKQRNERR